MVRSRPALVGGIVVALLVVAAAAGLFGIQYFRAVQECSTQLSCTPVFSGGIAANALFASVSGLTVAIALAIGVGVSWQKPPVANSILARQIEDEGRNLEEYRLRRAQLDEWTAMAQARAMERAAMEQAGALAEAEFQAAQDEALMQQITIWEEDSPEQQQGESEDDARRRVMAEHLAHIARSRPELLAEVLRVWINQPIR
jgi:hypothetical protein